MEKTIQFQSVTIGGLVISKPLICVPYRETSGVSLDGELIGNIGNSTLRHFKVTLDYENQRIFLEPGKNFHKKFSRDKSGLLIGRTELGQPKIVFVASGSPGDRAGFMEGDVILSINNKKLHHGSMTVPIIRLMRKTAGTRHDFIIMREGKTKTIQLTLEDLY